MEYYWDSMSNEFMDIHPLIIKRGTLGNPLKMAVFMGKSSMNGGFSIAMLDYRSGPSKIWDCCCHHFTHCAAIYIWEFYRDTLW
jgi:hypothetical protein